MSNVYYDENTIGQFVKGAVVQNTNEHLALFGSLGHVEGFSLSAMNEVLILVQWVDSPTPKPVHPFHLKVLK